MTWRNRPAPTSETVREWTVYTTEVDGTHCVGTFDTIVEACSAVVDIATNPQDLDPVEMSKTLQTVDWLFAIHPDVQVEPPDVLKPYYENGRSLNTDGGPYDTGFFLFNREYFDTWDEFRVREIAHREREKREREELFSKYLKDYDA